MFGLTTIRQGERAAVWDQRGALAIIDGPRRIVHVGRQVERLTQYVACPDQYLVVAFKDGRRDHVRGPAAVWFDPLAHQEIAVRQAMALDANEAVVIYRQETGGVSRRVERGPAMFVPFAREWLHEFSWHGADPRRPNHKIPRALKFTKLRVIPDQMYYDVDEVRTADDALVTVKLMLFFELAEIETMLDQTHDPVADFLNAVSADVMDFSSVLTFEQFKEQTERLNHLETYPQLTGRAERIGYRVNKVVYRGYHATDRLQAMHDHAIEARTQLRLEAETERQAQESADLKLAREAVRSVERQRMETSEAEHRRRLAQLDHEDALRRERAERETRLDLRRRANELALERRQAEHREHVAYLQGIQALQVDVTRYLVAQYQHPDRLIRVEQGLSPQLHVHEN